MVKQCSIYECERPAHARTWCIGHYQRWRTLGDPGGLLPDRTPEVRFWSKVVKAGPEDCWIWTGNRTEREGHGRFHNDGHMVVAHRWSYEQSVGPIPEGLVLDHVYERGCRSKLCVNPAHLEPVTNRENVVRAWRAKGFACERHEYMAGSGIGPGCDKCASERKLAWKRDRLKDPAYRERQRAQERARYWARKESA